MSDNELGAFLRARREAITPAQVGLPAGPRRRTSGLNRAELATLAGVSVDYLTRLEQGRDRHPSVQVLAALADALRLPTQDRMHLRILAKAAGGDLGQMCPWAEQPPAREVRPTVRALLTRVEPTPAYVVNRLGEVLAHTSGYERLTRPLGLLDTQPPSLIRWVFTDPRARTALPEWDRIADEHVANFRIESAGADPYHAELADELTVTTGAPFTERMAAPPALPKRTGVERWVHPDVGELRLAYETLDLPADDGQRLVVYLPADEASSATLDHLTGRHPGALRAVAG